MKRSSHYLFALFSLLLALAPGLRASEVHLGLLGNIPEAKTVEVLAAKIAVDAANQDPKRPVDNIKLVALGDKDSVAGALDAAEKFEADPDLMGVVVFGETGADPSVLKSFADAGLPVVEASSWMTPRSLSTTALWLSPRAEELAQIAAVYARKARQSRQAAVIDNGAPTANAAAEAFAQRFKELGGKVNYEGQWQGSDWGLTRTVKDLSANWPQVIFYAGQGQDAGVLVKAMQKEHALKSSVLIGLPTLFEPGFIDTARLQSRQSVVVFPCPDFRSSALIGKQLGISVPRSSPQYRAYVSYSNKHPGRWTSMIFDGMQLLVDAVNAAATAPQSLSPGAGLSLSAESSAATMNRASVLASLYAIPAYRGIRGKVKFGPTHEPLDPKGMIFTAQSKTDTREIRWLEYNYGPPF